MSGSERESDWTSEEWRDGLDNRIQVHINPYKGVVRVNEREFEISALLSDDVDSWLYRDLSAGSDGGQSDE